MNPLRPSRFVIVASVLAIQILAVLVPGIATFASGGSAGFEPVAVSASSPGLLGTTSSIVVPGRIEAEDYRAGGPGVGYLDTTQGNTGGACRADDVDLNATQDAGGGCNVGWIVAGEWLAYEVDVQAAGSYSLTARVATIHSGRAFHIEIGGVDVSGPVQVPQTGGWQSWTSVTVAGIDLQAGAQELRVVADSSGFNLNYIDAQQQTGGGIALPGRLEVEDYKLGGPGTGYNDTTAGNTGGACRDDDVDLQTTSDTGGGCNAGWIAAGEWLAYDVDVAATGDYSVTFRVASPFSGKRLHLEVDGGDVSGAVALPQTGGWQVWQDVTVGPLALTAGSHTLRLSFDTSGFNINYVDFTAVGPTPAISVPGRIEAEDYGDGGPDVGYVDTTPGNTGGAYRSDDVDIRSTTDVGGGYHIGWIAAGEWLEYDIEAAADGELIFTARIATIYPDRRFHIEVDGQDVTGPIAIPNTGSWSNWADVSTLPIAITAGHHRLRIVMDTANFNINYVDVADAFDLGTAEVLVGAGDIAVCGSEDDERTANLLDAIPGTVFTLGDNAYVDGTAAEFANCYEPSWGRHKARTRPSPGNHDYNTPNASGYYGYFGAAAGDPTRGYYSYDLGGWHVVVLNSNCAAVGGCGPGSAQEQWLRQDLAASISTCTVAYMHHPRYSSGFHGDNTNVHGLWQALYDAAVELLLVGHDHNYERFAPQGRSGSFNPELGIRQIIVGTGGVELRPISTVRPNSMVRDATTHGVLKLTLFDSGYYWEFIPETGGTFADAGSDTCH